jgi:hypothetical protein
MRALRCCVISALILLFCLQGGIAYWLMQHRIWTVKKEMKALVMSNAPEHLITEIHFSESEFNHLEWPEPWEFIHNGNMYDVVKTTKNTDGSYTIQAVIDNQENVLKTVVRNLVEQSSASRHAKTQFQFILKTLNHLFCNRPVTFAFSDELLCIQNHFLINSLWIKQHFNLEIDSPPNFLMN